MRKGGFPKVEEHKVLGTWVDKTGKYKINIIKKQEKTPHMIAYTKGIANRIHYTKLMLYNHIVHSDDDRIIKRIVMQQRESPRKGTWYYGVQELIEKYKIRENVEEMVKSAWKSIVKANVRRVTEEHIRTRCGRKGRTVVNDKFETSPYLKETSIKECKSILMMRLRMTNTPCKKFR